MADCIDLRADALEEITLFESLGLAVDDLAASFIAEAARVGGRGALINI